jgi:AP-3 complex subunit delta-1
MSSLGSQRRVKPESSMMGSASTYIFQKNLKDMITAIRAQKGDGSQKNFINKCLQDIRTEVRRC